MKKLLCAMLAIPMLLAAKTVISNGGSTIPVVLPANASPANRTAAAELTSYLEKITGAKFKTVAESQKPTGPAIYLGQTAFAAENKLDLKKFGDEEWLIRTVGGNLVIAGGEPRGTLFGVYHFLEDVLGVRWLSPTVEYVPKKTLLEVDKLDMRGKPRLAYRAIYLVPGEAGGRFLARNRMNIEYNPNMGARMYYSLAGNGHTMYTALGDSKFIRKLYREHPEYFPLIDNKRTLDPNRADGGSQSQFCLTDPGLRKLWVETLRKHIKTDRARAKKLGMRPPMFYAIDQNDCYDGFCNCAQCGALTKREGRSGLMLDFVNHIASELKNEAPDAVFQMMALHSTELPPKTLKARENVGIRLCDTTSDMLKPWSDPVNAKHRKNLEAWAKISKNIVMWDYSIVYGAVTCVNYPMPTARTFAPDLRMLAENSGGGVFFEHEQVIGGDMRDMKVWIEIKLAENPYLDYEKLLKNFTDHYFGARAGAQIREYLALIENAANRAKARVTWFPTLSSFSYIDADVMIKASKIFDKAAKLAGSGELLERVEYARSSLDRLYLIKAGAYKKALANSKKSAAGLPDVKQVLARYKRVMEREYAKLSPETRKNRFFINDHENNVKKFLTVVAKRRDLPTPPEFMKIAPSALYLYGAGMAQTYVSYQKLVKDPESAAGEALCAKISDVMKVPHKSFREDKFKHPFEWAVWPSFTGTVRGKLTLPDGDFPKGYHWYKLADGIKLNQNSVVSMFAGFFIALDGAVSDNSELGQKYDVWISMKITGPDFRKNGLPFPENVFYVDQAAAIRITSNSGK